MPLRPSTFSTHEYVLLVVVCIAPFLVVLDTNVVTVALPEIRADVGFSLASRPGPERPDCRDRGRGRRTPGSGEQGRWKRERG